MPSNNYFIKRGYKTNPVATYSPTGANEYWTTDRIRNSCLFQYHVYQYAKKVFKAYKCQSVLDVGSGPGLKTKIFFRDAKRIALIDQPATEPIARRIFPSAEFYPGHLEDPALNIGSIFDLIICADVIEHLENPNALLQILKAHMTFQSLAIISTPDRDIRWGPDYDHSPNRQHVREWNALELRLYLEHSGFQIIEHIHFPLQKLNPVLFALSRTQFFYKRFRKQRWYPNQTTLVKLKKNRS